MSGRLEVKESKQLDIQNVVVTPLERIQKIIPTEGWGKGKGSTESYNEARSKIDAALHQIRKNWKEPDKIPGILEHLKSDLTGIGFDIPERIQIIIDSSKSATYQALAVFIKSTIEQNDAILNYKAYHVRGLGLRLEANMTLKNMGKGNTRKEIERTLDEASKKIDDQKAKQTLLSILDGAEFKKKLGELVGELNDKNKKIKDYKAITADHLTYDHMQNFITCPRYQFFIGLYVAMNEIKNKNLSAEQMYQKLQTVFSQIKFDSGKADIFIKGFDPVDLDRGLEIIRKKTAPNLQLPTRHEVQEKIREVERNSIDYKASR